jgi:hypothetical protein
MILYLTIPSGSNFGTPLKLHDCMVSKTRSNTPTLCSQALRLNFPNPGQCDNILHVGAEEQRLFHIYRDDYSAEGREICTLLERFGGPKCKASSTSGEQAPSAPIDRNLYNYWLMSDTFCTWILTMK